MITQDIANNLKNGQEIWYKNLHIVPEKCIVDYVDDKGIWLQNDDTYISKSMYEYTYLTENECIEACEKELKDKIEKLKLMIKMEK